MRSFSLKRPSCVKRHMFIFPAVCSVVVTCRAAPSWQDSGNSPSPCSPSSWCSVWRWVGGRSTAARWGAEGGREVRTRCSLGRHFLKVKVLVGRVVGFHSERVGVVKSTQMSNLSKSKDILKHYWGKRKSHQCKEDLKYLISNVYKYQKYKWVIHILRCM